MFVDYTFRYTGFHITFAWPPRSANLQLYEYYFMSATIVVIVFKADEQ